MRKIQHAIADYEDVEGQVPENAGSLRAESPPADREPTYRVLQPEGPEFSQNENELGVHSSRASRGNAAQPIP